MTDEYEVESYEVTVHFKHHKYGRGHATVAFTPEAWRDTNFRKTMLDDALKTGVEGFIKHSKER